MADVYVPKDSALVCFDGQDYYLHANITTFDAAHPLRAGRPELFKPIEIIHRASAPANPSRADQRGARTR